MTKKKIIGAIGGVVALAGAAFILVTSGIPSSASNLSHLRGTDAYYTEATPQTQVGVGGELLTNLADKTIAKMTFNAEFRVGREWAADSPDAAAAAFAKNTTRVRSALIVMMGSKTSSDLRGSSLLTFKEEVVQMLNRIVFPDGMARVDDIVFETLLVQS